MKRKAMLQNDCFIGEVDAGIENNTEEISLSPVSDCPVGTTVSSFSFDRESIPSEASNVKQSANIIEDNRKLKTEANVSTPPVDGETYTISRFYKLRYSTAKMLNEIKAAHPDVNVYMNTIVDEAIRHYYSYIFEKGYVKE